MNEKEKLIPRKIWLIWYQGLSEAPFIVKKCIESWVSQNPSWDIVILDSENLSDYVDLELPKNTAESISLVHQSDLIRLALLSKFGGVWADSTTFCVKPLDEWIDDYAESGFFAFDTPGKDRVMSTWFLASKKGSPIMSKLYQKLRSYWVDNNFNEPNKIQRYAKDKLSKHLNQSYKTTKYWFNPLVTKLLRVYPYFACHYMFERLVSKDNESKSIWNKTKRISADIPHLVQSLGMLSQPSDLVKEQINNDDIPMFKLTWKYDHKRYNEDTLLKYLIEERANKS